MRSGKDKCAGNPQHQGRPRRSEVQEKRELYIYYPDGMGKSKLVPALDRVLEKTGTARNWNAVTELARDGGSHGSRRQGWLEQVAQSVRGLRAKQDIQQIALRDHACQTRRLLARYLIDLAWRVSGQV